eukprot:Nk52_evm111s914 gene=Nk52_evmTU111s914
MSDGTERLTEGCFLFNAAECSKNRKTVPGSLVNPLLESETEKHLALREQAFKYCWESIDSGFKVTRATLDKTSFENVGKWLRSVCDHSAQKAKYKSPFLELPTAVLYSGVNVSDHGHTITRLIEYIQSDFSAYFVRLKTRECTNLKNTIRQIIEDVVSAKLGPDCFSGYSDGEDYSLPAFTFQALETWYQYRKSKTCQSPPIVILLEEFEGFPAHVVEDLISISSNYSTKLPIVFVFGIATSMDIVHRKLSRSAVALLQIQKFQMQLSSAHLNAVIDELILDSGMPFGLGRHVFSHLIDKFLFENFSSSVFVDNMKMAALEHFSTNPLSFMCSKALIDEAKDNISGDHSILSLLTDEHLEVFRKTSSFRRYVHSKKNDPQTQINLLESNAYLRDIFPDLIREFLRYRERFIVIFGVFFELISSLPQSVMGGNKREVYCLILDNDVSKLPQFCEIIKWTQVLSLEQIVTFAKKSLKILHDHQNEWKSVIEQFHVLLNMLNSSYINEALLDERTPQSTNEQRSTITEPTFDEMREKFALYLQGIFTEYLRCSLDYPASCIFVMRNHLPVADAITGKPRIVIQKGLSKPSKYIQSKNWSKSIEGLNPLLPDTSIAYYLYLECGSLINLYDWLHAFSFVIRQSNGSEESVSNESCQ